MLPCQPSSIATEEYLHPCQQKMEGTPSTLCVIFTDNLFCHRICAGTSSTFVPFSPPRVHPLQAPPLLTPTGHLLYKMHTGIFQVDFSSRLSSSWSAQTTHLCICLHVKMGFKKGFRKIVWLCQWDSEWISLIYCRYGSYIMFLSGICWTFFLPSYFLFFCFVIAVSLCVHLCFDPGSSGMCLMRAINIPKQTRLGSGILMAISVWTSIWNVSIALKITLKHQLKIFPSYTSTAGALIKSKTTYKR